ncbi:MAG: hypothetical protein K6C05_02700 [Anaerovibrio sp.]|uniref:hypothetical protein n=1 Tax=Anaerovibrio sp. TaxID=1872532 RepID=UPI0025ECA1D3|nr:hypothetical protein [Anaerovibrio sp.]MCR5175740.1 hypothetical protein [Anaerovibrio sp.]
MSMFLGPIHFWLYNKIDNQEKLTKRVADLAVNNGWLSDGDKYTYDLPELADAIDASNIHGWLQAKIVDAESRFAQMITDILSADGTRIDSICAAAVDFGKGAAIVMESSAMEAYKAFEDFFLNGMPCDRVNVLTDQTESSVSWEMAEDIHAASWPKGDTSVYYHLKKAVMDGMLSDTGLKITMKDIFHYEISKR